MTLIKDSKTKIFIACLIIMLSVLIFTIIYSKPKPEINIIYNFCDLMNKRDYDEALKLLTYDRASVYEFNNRASMRNIKHMEIKSLEDKTNEWGTSTNIFLEDIYEYKVFYAQIHYRLNNIIESAFKDNEIYHHRVVIVKYDKDSPWLIAELSTAPWWFMLELQSDTQKDLQ